jgi:hypothetical protein
MRLALDLNEDQTKLLREVIEEKHTVSERSGSRYHAALYNLAVILEEIDCAIVEASKD